MRYKKLFWGFFFVLIGLNINNFDIFPDIIGYILIFIALTDLNEVSSDFAKPKVHIIVLSIIWLIDNVVYIFGGKFSNNLYGSILFAFVFSIGVCIYTLYVYKLIFDPLSLELINKHKTYLSQSLMNNFKIFSILSIISNTLILFMIFIPLLAFFVLPLAIAIIVFSIRLLINLNTIKNELI